MIGRGTIGDEEGQAFLPIGGRCLCGGVRFELLAAPRRMRACHCSLCRRQSGSAFCVAVHVAPADLRWLAEEDQIQVYERPPSWRTAFCRVCGSPVPEPGATGPVLGIPAGLLDRDPGIRVESHIFVGSKAPWDEIGGSAPQHPEFPPRRPHRPATS